MFDYPWVYRAEEINNPHSLSVVFAKELSQYKAGTLSKADFVKIGANWAKLNAKTMDPDTNKLTLLANKYASDYRDLVSDGIKDRANGKTKR